MNIRPVRGTHDLFGEEIQKYNIIKKIVSTHADFYSFQELKTPIFEFTELFSKPLGEHSDVVLKEMYTFKDRNDESITLRPEYTTPMIRAAISNNILNDLPAKLFGIGPMFRRERPQKGRYRQFNQINFEIFGVKDFLADLELIILAHDILKKLIPSTDFVLHLNNLGQKENLSDYKTSLRKYFNINKNKLSSESFDKIDKNPLRILDSKDEADINVSNNAPSIQEFINNEDKIHFEEIKKSLKLNDIKFVEDQKLVRGLDYYCSTVFEFKTSEIGAQDTLLGGGRYDGLIKALGGPNIPGIGWAAGIERISMLMKINKKLNNHIHIAINNEKFKTHLQKIMTYLIKNNIPYYWNYKYNLKKSLTKANSLDANNIIIIGENEFNNNFYTLKNLRTGKQSELQIDEIKNFLNDKS